MDVLSGFLGAYGERCDFALDDKEAAKKYSSDRLILIFIGVIFDVFEFDVIVDG